MTGRNKPGWVFWMTVVVVLVPLPYVLSIGPACWWFARYADFFSYVPVKYAPKPYWPVGWIAKRSRPVRKLAGWYVGDSFINLPADWNGDSSVPINDPFDW